MNSQEPTLSFAIWRNRTRVIVISLIGLLLGVSLGFLAGTRAPVRAEASFLIRQPSALSLDSTFNDAEIGRYVADQVEIIQSPEVLEQAAARLEAATGKKLSIRDFDEALTIQWSVDSTVATAVFSDPEANVALTATNALLDAYQTLLIEQSTANGAAAIELTNEAIEESEAEIASLEAELASLAAQETPETARLNQLALEAANISAEMAVAGEARRQALAAQLGGITVQMDLLRLLVEVTPRPAAVVQVERRLEQAVAEQNALRARRSTIEIDVRLNQAPAVVFSDARIFEDSALSLPIRFGLAGALVGFFLAAGRAYARTVRNETVENAAEPEALLGAPLLAEIQDFDDEGVLSQLPVRDEPRSLSAEGFRFLAAATDIRVADLKPRSIAIVGTSVGAGKTTTAANLALATARQGSRVLVVDADFGNQALSALFGIDNMKVLGITELINGQAKIAEAGARVLGVDGSLTIISRGRVPAIAPNLFRTESASAMFAELGEHFDLVIVDTPPLLQVAYATSIVANVGGSIVVVPRGANVEDIVATATRLRSIGSEILGYTFHRTRAERGPRPLEGSLRDVIGDDGFLTAQKTRSRT